MADSSTRSSVTSQSEDVTSRTCFSSSRSGHSPSVVPEATTSLAPERPAGEGGRVERGEPKDADDRHVAAGLRRPDEDVDAGRVEGRDVDRAQAVDVAADAARDGEGRLEVAVERQV